MARNTKTFSDLDFNFTSLPGGAVVVPGNITTLTTSKVVTGTNTRFLDYPGLVDATLYTTTNQKIGRVQAINSNTSITLVANSVVAVSGAAFKFASPTDVSRKYNEEAIKASVRNLINTRNYERPFHSEIGSQVRSLLFENYSPMLDALMKRAITDTITNFEPRVELLDVVVNSSPDTNAIYITIHFSIINTYKPLSVDVVLERTR